MAEPEQIPLSSSSDVVTARLKGRAVALGLGFDGLDVNSIAFAITKLARFIVGYSRRGEILLEPVRSGDQWGLKITARAQGCYPDKMSGGLDNPDAMARELSVAIASLREMMDELTVTNPTSSDTTVIMRKWPFHEPDPLTPSLFPTGGEGVRRTGEGEGDPVQGLDVIVQDSGDLP